MTKQWIKVCNTANILPNCGAAVLVLGLQIAIFRVNSDFYAISDYDPFSGAYVLARGIIGDRGGVIKVSSPIYKQSFSLLTGECLDDPSVKLPTYPIRVIENDIYLSIQTQEETINAYQTVFS